MNTDYPTEQWAVYPPESGLETPRTKDLFARPMFWLAFFHLLFLAAFFHRWQYPGATDIERQAILYGMVACWIPIAIGALVRWVISGFSGLEFLRALLYIALPPFRMGAPSIFRTGEIWFPFLGWQTLNKRLPEKLELRFAGPMILFAVMVIPLVLIEYFRAEQIKSNEWLRWGVHVAAATIWVAFALEFILKVSVARRTFRFMTAHWLDVAIVIIPTLTFLLGYLANTVMLGRILRLSRAFSPQYLARMGKLYRLRGLGGRAWASVLTLDLLTRLMGKDPLQERLRRLRKREESLLEELDDVRQAMIEVRQVLAAREVGELGERGA